MAKKASKKASSMRARKTTKRKSKSKTPKTPKQSRSAKRPRKPARAKARRGKPAKAASPFQLIIDTINETERLRAKNERRDVTDEMG